MLVDNTKVSSKKMKEILTLCPGLTRLKIKQSLKQFDFKTINKTILRELELD